MLLLPAVLTGATMVFEITRTVNLRSDLQAASDAAVLSIVTRGIETEAEATVFTRQMITAWQQGRYPSGDLEVDPTFAADEVVLDIGMTLSPVFMQIGDVPNLTVKVRSAAARGGSQRDVYLLLDRSSSMLIGDTWSDIDDLMALSKPMIRALGPDEWEYSSEPEGCAFACHTPERWQTDGRTMLDLAVENGIGLRRARIADAGGRLAARLMEGGGTRIGVINFTGHAEVVLEPGSDAATVRSAIASTHGWEGGMTDYPALFAFLEDRFAAQGSGTVTDPESLLILVTDGLYNYTDETTGDFVTEAFEAGWCDGLKRRGFGIVVVNTLYEPLSNSQRYDNLVAPVAGQVGPNLRACASDGYYEAPNAGMVDAAFGALQRSLGGGTLRITR